MKRDKEIKINGQLIREKITKRYWGNSPPDNLPRDFLPLINEKRKIILNKLNFVGEDIIIFKINGLFGFFNFFFNRQFKSHGVLSFK
jgi:hypothetical protein